MADVERGEQNTTRMRDTVTRLLQVAADSARTDPKPGLGGFFADDVHAVLGPAALRDPSTLDSDTLAAALDKVAALAQSMVETGVAALATFAGLLTAALNEPPGQADGSDTAPPG